MVVTRRGRRVVQAMVCVATAATALAVTSLVSGSGGSGVDDAWTRMRGEEALAAAPCPSPGSIALAPVSPHRLEAARAGRFQVFGDRATELRVPIDWHIDPLGAHRYRQNLQKLRFLEPLLWSYASSGDVDDLRAAARVGVDWARQNPLAKPGIPAEAWSDKVIGDRVPYLAYLLRAAGCEDLLGDDDRRLLLGSISDHARALASRRKFVPDNHGLFVDLGLLRLVNFFPFLERADDWRELARRRFETTLRGRLSEGVWLEHSTAYQFLAIRAVEQFLTVHGTDAELEELLAQMRQAAAWFVKPDGEATQFGDSDLEPVPEWGTSEAAALDGMKVFFDAGFAFVRASGDGGDVGYLAVGDGFHNHTHKHADELGFELFDHGTSIVSDTGLYDKDPGPVRDFVTSARAHSVLTVDQLPFPIDAAGGTYGSGLIAAGSGAGWYAIEGTNPLVKPLGVRHRRLFLYRPGVALLVIDRLRSAAPHIYTRYLQLHPDIDLQPAGGGDYEISASGFEGAIFDLDTGIEATSSKARGQHNPLQGLASPSFRTWRPRWTIAYLDQATSESRVLSIALDDSSLRADRVEVEAHATTVGLVDAAGTRSQLTVTPDGQSLTITEASG